MLDPKTDWIAKRVDLRSTAEAMLSSVAKLPAQPSVSDVLLNELLIHKVELEVQLEELKRSNVAMEEARDRYLDLFESSPVGYLTITRTGLISQLNLTAAGLLGVDRLQMTNCRFWNLVAPKDQERWHRLFLNIMEDPTNESCSFSLDMLGPNGILFIAYIDCQRHDESGGAATLRLTLVDHKKWVPEDTLI
jgi:PAS domain S-box-containing protein